MPIDASDWRPCERNTLRGFVTLTLAPSGIAIRDCTYHQHANGKEWVGLPGKAQLDDAGQVRRDPRTGKVLYAAVIDIPDPDARERFQSAALAAVRRLIGDAR